MDTKGLANLNKVIIEEVRMQALKDPAGFKEVKGDLENVHPI